MFQTITGKPFCPTDAIAAPENLSAGSSRKREPRPTVGAQSKERSGGVSGTRAWLRAPLGNTRAAPEVSACRQEKPRREAGAEETRWRCVNENRNGHI